MARLGIYPIYNDFVNFYSKSVRFEPRFAKISKNICHSIRYNEPKAKI